MKKLLLLLFIFLPGLMFSQVSKTYFSVTDSSVKFRTALKAKQLIFDEARNIIYVLDSAALRTETLDSSDHTAISGAAYTSGTGITVSGTTVTHIAHTADATGATSITVVALRGRSIATITPTSGNILGWDGTYWTPVTHLPYTAGTGITISTNTISVLYVAGTGLSLSSNSFAHEAHTGDATGTTSLTVVALRGNPIATTTPSTGQFLKWDGTYWIPAEIPTP